MCLIAFAYRIHPGYPLLLIGNRDEFHQRPTRAADFLDSERLRFGGRDLLAGGGWLQVHRHGALTAVTNVRHGKPESGQRSRGMLVAELLSTARPTSSLRELTAEDFGAYGRFNLLTYDADGLHYASNHPHHRRESLAPGLYGLSNGDLNAPWPKTEASKAALSHWIRTGDTDLEPLFVALADPTTYPDHLLPNTGVNPELERALSAAFIVGDAYGTRASTVVCVADDHIQFVERSFGPGGRALGERSERIERTAP